MRSDSERLSRGALVSTLVRATATAAALVLVYYTVPFTGALSTPGLLILIGGGALFCVLGWRGTRSIIRSPTPRARGIQVLATVLPLFLIIFAATYYVMSQNNSGAFSSQFTRTDSLYFTVTTFATVGFGDLTPVSDTARVVAMVQMLGDFVLIGLGVRVLLGAVELGLRRQQNGSPDSPRSAPPVPHPAESDEPARERDGRG